MWAYEKEHYSGGVDGGNNSLVLRLGFVSQQVPRRSHRDITICNFMHNSFFTIQNNKIKTMNFTNTAIKCDTWEQMQHLARIAEEQGYKASKWFKEECFDDGDVFFEITNGNEYNCFTLLTFPVTTYTKFINQSDTPSVYGC